MNVGFPIQHAMALLNSSLTDRLSEMALAGA